MTEYLIDVHAVCDHLCTQVQSFVHAMNDASRAPSLYFPTQRMAPDDLALRRRSVLTRFNQYQARVRNGKLLRNNIKFHKTETTGGSIAHMYLAFFLCAKIQFHRIVSSREMSDSLILRPAESHAMKRVVDWHVTRIYGWRFQLVSPFFWSRVRICERRAECRRGEERENTETKSYRSTWKGERGFVVTAGTDFIRLSSLYIFLLQGVAAPAFSRSRILTQPSLLTLDDFLSLSLSSPAARTTDTCIHRQPPHFVHCAFISSPNPSSPRALSIAHPLFRT